MIKLKIHKTYLLILLALLPMAATADAANDKLRAMFDEWDKIAAKYEGTNDDLSVPSKRAIVLGKPELAEKPYLAAYNSDFGRKQFGVESLFQIFLVYIDPTNSARSLKKSLYYLKKMEEEWPDTEETRKANVIYGKVRTE